MKNLKVYFVLSLIISLCLFVPCLSACFDDKILISYSHITISNDIPINDLPRGKQVKVESGYKLEPFPETNDLKVIEYRIYSTENEFTNVYPHQSINQNTVIIVVWGKSNYNQEAYNELDEIIEKIKKLEEISNLYNQEKNSTKDASLRALQYIRQNKYSGLAWNIVAGNIEKDFSDYVKQNQGDYNLESLQTIQNFTSPKTGDKIDFVHMLSAINVILYGGLDNLASNDLATWGGDLCQLAIQLKNTGLTGEELQTKSDSMFNNTNSSFSCYDVLANSDAFAIAKLYKDLNFNSISTTFENYYKLTNLEQRNKVFLQIAFPEIYENNKISVTEQDFVNIIVNRVTSNSLLGVWCSTQGANINSLQTQIQAVALSFAKYYLS